MSLSADFMSANVGFNLAVQEWVIMGCDTF